MACCMITCYDYCEKILFSKLVYVLCPRASGGDATFQNFLFIGKNVLVYN